MEKNIRILLIEQKLIKITKMFINFDEKQDINILLENGKKILYLKGQVYE